MELVSKVIKDWPKLAWVAIVKTGSQIINVWHGPMVEVDSNANWISEAVWAGDFVSGGFDQTDIVFGTGIRLRDNQVVFVSSGSVFDRILYCKKDKDYYVSNTLPGLLSITDLSLKIEYPFYSKDIRSIIQGIEKRNRKILTDGEDIISIYYNNLIFDGKRVFETEKSDTAPHFTTFEDYSNYLVKTAKLLGKNAGSPKRTNCVLALSSISSGYDSSVAACISRFAGCKSTVSIKESSSFWRGSDSGKTIAKYLGMTCKEYSRIAKNYPMEEAIWAAEGRPGILNWTQFDYLEPLCLFFTGCHGEKLWDRVNHDHPDPFVRRDTSSLGFCEYRLLKGVFQCPVPFWGVRHAKKLRAITENKDMKYWYMNKDYDKPIARRIIEAAGVPRALFGSLNKNTSLEKPFWWPKSKTARKSFQKFLERNNIYVPSEIFIQFLSILAQLDTLFYQNILKKIGIKGGPRPWDKIKARFLVFHWANEELKKRYSHGLKNSKV